MYNSGATQDNIRQLLCASFPIAPLNRLTHEECIEMRNGIVTLVPKDVPPILGQVLKDLLETHGESLYRAKNADLLVMCLNVLSEDTDYDGIQLALGERAKCMSIQQDKDATKRNLELFSLVTPEQANAISQWLEFALTWPDMVFDVVQIKAALRYWRHRSQIVFKTERYE